MKWRVNRPDLQFVNLPPEPVEPDIVEADCVDIQEGCLMFRAGDHLNISKIYAPGQWTTVERVGDEND